MIIYAVSNDLWVGLVTLFEPDPVPSNLPFDRVHSADTLVVQSADTRFFRACGPFVLNYIASHIGVEESSTSTSNIWIHGVGDLETAGSGDLSVFLSRSFGPFHMLCKLFVLRSDDQHLIADTHIGHFRAVVPQCLSRGPIASDWVTVTGVRVR